MGAMGEHFGDWLKARILARFGTLRAFAEAIGKEPTYISRWVNGHERPSYESARQIADLLGIPIAEVLERAGMPIRATDAEALPRPAAIADVIAAMERDPEIIAALAEIKDTQTDATYRRVVEQLADAWKSNGRMMIATWRLALGLVQQDPS